MKKDRTKANKLLRIGHKILKLGYVENKEYKFLTCQILMSLFFKAFLTFRSMLLLVDRKFGIDAGILTRTLFEILHLPLIFA